VLRYYGGSFTRALETVYPNIGIDKTKFTILPSTSLPFCPLIRFICFSNEKFAQVDIGHHPTGNNFSKIWHKSKDLIPFFLRIGTKQKLKLYLHKRYQIHFFPVFFCLMNIQIEFNTFSSFFV
jgi:hypothetical protein